MVNLVGLITNPLSDKVSTFIGLFDIIIALCSILIGVSIITRFKGKLKSSIIFLILAIAVMVAREALILVNIETPDFVVGLMRVLIVLFILLAILTMKWMIDSIDGHYKK